VAHVVRVDAPDGGRPVLQPVFAARPARSRGFCNAAFQQYLREKGFTEDDITLRCAKANPVCIDDLKCTAPSEWPPPRK
jgi:hypothetical protein